MPKHLHRLALGIFGAEMKTLSRVVALNRWAAVMLLLQLPAKVLAKLPNFGYCSRNLPRLRPELNSQADTASSRPSR